jgi:hypothetical protein
MGPYFQGLPWFECYGLGEGELLIRFLINRWSGRICMILFSVNGRYCILVQVLIAHDKRSTYHSRSVSVYACPHISTRPPPTGRIFVKFGIGDFHENMSNSLIFFYWGQKHRALYMMIWVRVMLLAETVYRESIVVLPWWRFQYVLTLLPATYYTNNTNYALLRFFFVAPDGLQPIRLIVQP